MKRRDVLATVGGAAAVGLAGCTALGNQCSSGNYDVGMGDSAFEPETVTVAVGDAVRWLNDSGRGHTVTAYDSDLPEGADFFASGGFDSTQAAREGWKDGEGRIDVCETYEHTFETAGEFPYLCIPHEAAGMVGTVVVEG